MANSTLTEKGSSLGAATQQKTYTEQAYEKRLNYKPPVGGPTGRPFQFVGGGTVPGGVGPSPNPTSQNQMLINSSDFLLINATDKIII